VLAFPAADRTRAKDGLNRIEVKVARPDVTVQARTAYEVGQTPQAAERELRKAPIVRALESTLPRTDVPMTLTATPVPAGRTDATTVVVALRVEPAVYGPSDLPEGRRQAGASQQDAIDVVVAALDPQGKIVASTKHTGTVPWEPGLAGPAPYELLSRLELKPGRYEIRAVMDVRSGERSGVYGFVDVPKYSDQPLAMSGIVLQVVPAPMTEKATLANLLPIVPTAQRTFAPGDRVTAFARLSSRQALVGVVVVARVLDTAGRVAFEDRRNMSGTEYLLDLPIERLTPGEHLLELRASVGKDEATGRLRFSVR
jgi:hypothetical protein